MDEFISTLKKELGPHSCSVKLLARTPKPIIYLEVDDPNSIAKEIETRLFINLAAHAKRALAQPDCFLCRGVCLDRLYHVLSHGCDVEPTNSVIYADFIDKALEYGDSRWPAILKGKVILVLRWSRMSRSLLDVPSNIDESALKALRKEYPTALTSPDGSRIRRSRLPEEHPNLDTSNEAAYGWYIPGDAFDALYGLLIFGDGPTVETHIREAISNCTSVEWR